MQTMHTLVDNLRILHKKERTLSNLRRILLALVFTGITGLSAQVRFYLPFTPVPVTGQVFAVLLSGAVLGKEYGSMSQLMYVFFGLLGIPWFVIGPVGPTWGYLVGFICAPYVIGFMRERVPAVRPMTTVLSMACGLAVIYLFGLLHFSLFTKTGIMRSFLFSVLPFIPFDALKAMLAAGIAHILLRRTQLFA